MIKYYYMNYTGNDNLEIMKLAKNYNNFLAKIVTKQIKEQNCKNILDFGCAGGYFIEKIKTGIPGINILGIETDDSSFETCKTKNIPVYKDLSPLSNLDLVYSFNVLEHIENDEETIKQIYDKIAANGLFIVYVPALMFLYSSMDKKTGHFRRYNKKGLSELIKRTGFTVIKAEYCDSLGILATLLYKLKDKIFNNNNGNLSKTGVTLYDKIFFISRMLDICVFKYFGGKNLLIIAKKTK